MNSGNRSGQNGGLGDALPASTGFEQNAEPAVRILAPSEVRAGGSVTFGVDFVDDGWMEAVLWDLAIGPPETGHAPSAAYDEPGDYVIHAVAWDDRGRAAHATHPLRVR